MRWAIRSSASAAAALTVTLGVGTAMAQDAPAGRRVVVLAFDDKNVASSVEEVMGGPFDLGRALSDLVRKRLLEHGIAVIEGDAAAEGRVIGSVLAFGREAGRGDVGGVRVRGVRVGVGRRQETAVVGFSAQLIDVASGQVVVMASGTGQSSRGGTELFARTRDTDLATLDLSSDAFRETSIGEATYMAVDELATQLVEGVARLGTFAAPQAMPQGPVTTPMASVGGGPINGPFAWAPYQFRGTEHFRYDVRQNESGETTTGHYTLDLTPAGENRVRMQVDGQLGDQTYSSSVTTESGADGVQMGYGQFMTLGPVGITLFNPTAWIMLSGREMSVGDGWSYGGGGESVSVKVEQPCAHAGQQGLLIVVRMQQEVAMESCVTRDVALPLRVLFKSDDTTIEMTLVEYRP